MFEERNTYNISWWRPPSFGRLLLKGAGLGHLLLQQGFAVFSYALTSLRRAFTPNMSKSLLRRAWNVLHDAVFERARGEAVAPASSAAEDLDPSPTVAEREADGGDSDPPAGDRDGKTEVELLPRGANVQEHVELEEAEDGHGSRSSSSKVISFHDGDPIEIKNALDSMFYGKKNKNDSQETTPSCSFFNDLDYTLWLAVLSFLDGQSLHCFETTSKAIRAQQGFLGESVFELAWRVCYMQWYYRNAASNAPQKVLTNASRLPKKLRKDFEKIETELTRANELLLSSASAASDAPNSERRSPPTDNGPPANQVELDGQDGSQEESPRAQEQSKTRGAENCGDGGEDSKEPSSPRPAAGATAERPLPPGVSRLRLEFRRSHAFQESKKRALRWKQQYFARKDALGTGREDGVDNIRADQLRQHARGVLLSSINGAPLNPFLSAETHFAQDFNAAAYCYARATLKSSNPYHRVLPLEPFAEHLMRCVPDLKAKKQVLRFLETGVAIVGIPFWEPVLGAQRQLVARKHHLLTAAAVFGMVLDGKYADPFILCSTRTTTVRRPGPEGGNIFAEVRDGVRPRAIPGSADEDVDGRTHWHVQTEFKSWVLGNMANFPERWDRLAVGIFQNPEAYFKTPKRSEDQDAASSDEENSSLDEDEDDEMMESEDRGLLYHVHLTHHKNFKYEPSYSFSLGGPPSAEADDSSVPDHMAADNENNHRETPRFNQQGDIGEYMVLDWYPDRLRKVLKGTGLRLSDEAGSQEWTSAAPPPEKEEEYEYCSCVCNETISTLKFCLYFNHHDLKDPEAGKNFSFPFREDRIIW